MGERHVPSAGYGSGARTQQRAEHLSAAGPRSRGALTGTTILVLSDSRDIFGLEEVVDLSKWRGGRLVVFSVFVLVGVMLLGRGQTALGIGCLALAVVYVPLRSMRDRPR